jgi:hypothetical protein
MCREMVQVHEARPCLRLGKTIIMRIKMEGL